MDVSFLNDISPFVRKVRIMDSQTLVGDFNDYDYVLTLVNSGSVIFRINNKKYTLKEGDVILMPPFLPHGVFSDEGKPLQQYIIHFDFFYDKEREKYKHLRAYHFPDKYPIPERERIFKEPVICHLEGEPLFEYVDTFLKMLNEIRSQSEFKNIHLKQFCYKLLSVFFEECIKSEKTLSAPKNSQSLLIFRAVDYIHTNYDNSNLSNEIIAEHIGVSTKYLSHLFQKEIGIPVHRYVNYIRIIAARRMALHGVKNISQIAETVGFKSPQSFSRVVRRITGQSPSQILNVTPLDNEEVYLKSEIPALKNKKW